MASRTRRPFAVILDLVGGLSADQKADLLDVLRPRPTRAKSDKPKVAKEPKPPKVKNCVICANPEEFADHKEDSPNYHKFRTEIKKKAATQ